MAIDSHNGQSLRPGSSQDNRGVWRIGMNDVEDFIAEAYKRTAERIASDGIKRVDPGTAS